MSRELQPYPRSDIERITRDYEPIRLAGIWERKPEKPPQDIFAFLALSLSKHEVPLQSIPLFRLDAGTTSERSNYHFPIVKVEDEYSDLTEQGLVQVVRRSRLSSEKDVQVWVPRRVNPLGLHPPIIQAVGSFMTEMGADWHPDALHETDINADFVTYRAPVSREKLRLELGGPTQQIRTSALAAAALRLAVAETILTQDRREVLDRYLEMHPEAKLIRGGSEAGVDE